MTTSDLAVHAVKLHAAVDHLGPAHFDDLNRLTRMLTSLESLALNSEASCPEEARFQCLAIMNSLSRFSVVSTDEELAETIADIRSGGRELMKFLERSFGLERSPDLEGYYLSSDEAEGDDAVAA